MFQPLGIYALSILADISPNHAPTCEGSLIIKDRRIDSSLLTENREKYWNVIVQGEERCRQARLLQRTHQQGSRSGRNRARQLS